MNTTCSSCGNELNRIRDFPDICMECYLKKQKKKQEEKKPKN